VTKLDQLRAQLRAHTQRIDELQARIAVLEGQPARPARPRRAPQPGRDIAGREALWARYIELEMRHGHGRVKLSKLAFAIRHRLNPDEFVRWFSAADRRGIPDSSGPDRNHRRALAAAIAELEQGGITTLNSHGKLPISQDSAARLQ
jgi:hypothetical protein